jgi:hypothetical protein
LLGGIKTFPPSDTLANTASNSASLSQSTNSDTDGVKVKACLGTVKQ